MAAVNQVIWAYDRVNCSVVKEIREDPSTTEHNTIKLHYNFCLHLNGLDKPK